MSPWLVALTGVIYFGVCLENIYLGKWSIAIMYFGYAFANIGLYIISKNT